MCTELQSKQLLLRCVLGAIVKLMLQNNDDELVLEIYYPIRYLFYASTQSN